MGFIDAFKPMVKSKSNEKTYTMKDYEDLLIANDTPTAEACLFGERS